ncbi:WecB/TagA/CpsF family glycosyltransferase [Thalassospira sp. HF15]|uniref:WecB/TagA/CpsF family glycosyltransferase n=1 Tax=Thalassospira sp. HF15 TaxID=2722755 RepID=UPI0014309A2D|nr:WecB/TagA/CpsF family glycosyltransferase [Thalassospira sp. HF15]NIY76905.1 WecB/TagA/CpsF family glycosyltransferase [Thalassospira sp. HF15]
MRDELKGYKAAFFGLPLDTRRRSLVCADIALQVRNARETDARTCLHHHCLNAIKLPAALQDDNLFAALARADCLSADGLGVVFAARLMGIKVAERVTGIDLLTDLLAQFAQDGTRIFLLGARQDVLDRLQVTLPTRFPGLIIAGTHHGYEFDDEKLADCVAKAKPDALFVALPSPRKELFVDQFALKTGCRFAMGVGGAFDVLAGKVRRAPVIWQRAGLEFLWRILCQPRYMIPRYGRGLLAFTRIVLPKVADFQFKRLRAAFRRAVIMLAAFAMLVPVSEVKAQTQPQTATNSDLEDRKAAVDWIEAEIANVKKPDDVTRLIDALLDDVLSNDSDSEQPVINWSAAESRLELLLGLFDSAFADGTSRFLLESVLGGVVVRLTNLHPDPERLAGVVRSNAAGLAERLLERKSDQRFTFADEQSSFSNSVESGAPTRFAGGAVISQNERLWRYSLFFIDGAQDPLAESLWDKEEYNQPTGIAELEDASPR